MFNTTDPIQENSKMLRDIAFEMKVLLVEDDITIQQQFKSFLLRFFSHVDTADHGAEALELYNKNTYDLVITDLTMPQMGGIALSESIRSIRSHQKILVLSAHSESDKLIELINIGVDGFMLKPIDMSRVIQILTRTCQSIYDHKMLHYFNNLLERTNNELKESNIELERTLNKLQQVRDGSSIGEIQTNEQAQIKEESVYFYDSYGIEKINEALEQIEDDFNILLVSSDYNTNHNLLMAFTILLKQYTHQMHLMPHFQKLADKLMNLTNQFGSLNEEVEEMNFLIPSVTSIFDHLEQWRRGIFVYKNVDDIHFMDEYLMKKIDDIFISIDTFDGGQ